MDQPQNVKVKKSPGPDGFRILTERTNTYKDIYKRTEITVYFVIQEGVVPQAWNVCQIAPIFTKGKKNLCDNYRPVSLTSTVYKVMQKIIRTQAIKYLNQFTSSCQYGFIERCSCTLSYWIQLIHGLDFWTEDQQWRQFIWILQKHLTLYPIGGC